MLTSDVGYSFDVDKQKPDLAVEINLTSGSIDDLTKYQYLKISEVWLWENQQIKFFQLDKIRAAFGTESSIALRDSPAKLSANSSSRKRALGYIQIAVSRHLPELTSDRVTEIVNSCFGKSVLEVEKYFA